MVRTTYLFLIIALTMPALACAAQQTVAQKKSQAATQSLAVEQEKIQLIESQLKNADYVYDIDTHAATAKEFIKIVKSAKVDKDARSKEGFTLLMLAAHYNCYTLVKWLLDQSADPSLTNGNMTALMCAEVAHTRLQQAYIHAIDENDEASMLRCFFNLGSASEIDGALRLKLLLKQELELAEAIKRARAEEEDEAVAAENQKSKSPASTDHTK